VRSSHRPEMKSRRVAPGRNPETAPQCHAEKNRPRFANFVGEDNSSSASKKSRFVNRVTLATFVAALPCQLGSVMFAKQDQSIQESTRYSTRPFSTNMVVP
jgi:hypothetical protein